MSKTGTMRQGKDRVSHAASHHLPSLQLGSSMMSQIAHERSGRLIQQASVLSSNDRGKLARALTESSIDLSKAQDVGHVHTLAAKLAESIIQHLLFAKGQLPEPISVSRRRQQRDRSERQPYTSRRNISSRTRKEERMLKKLHILSKLIKDALDSLADLEDAPSASTSSSQTSSQDVRLLLALGTSASKPRDTFVVELRDVIHQPTRWDADIVNLVQSVQQLDTSATDFEDLEFEVDVLQREIAREKTSSQWERKLVRMMVSAEDLEPFFSSSLAPTKMHVFLNATPQFRCPGWSLRRNLDFELCSSPLDGGQEDCSTSVLTSVSADNKASHTFLELQRRQRSFSRVRDEAESVSSITSSCMDSGSDSLFETSNTSFSDAGSQPPQYAAISSSLPIESRQEERLAVSSTTEDDNLMTSSGSATLGEDGAHCDLAKRGLDENLSSQTKSNKRIRDSAKDAHVRRKAKPPAATSLLSRNLLVRKDTSNTNTSRNARTRIPRCAGIRIDFSDPSASRSTSFGLAPAVERCWFQCDAVLEGYR